MPFLHAWHTDLGAAHAWPTAALGPAERARLARLRTPALRQTYARTHAFARAVLGDYLGQAAAALRFAADANGKPVLADAMAGLHFNLSYRPGCALLAVSDAGPVGADVEALAPLPDAGALVRHLFATDEQAALQAIRRASGPGAAWWRLFFTIWTRKEAYAKALGRGVGLDFAAFSALAGAGPAGYCLHSFGLPPATTTAAPANPAYLGAVAAVAPLPLRHFGYYGDVSA